MAESKKSGIKVKLTDSYPAKHSQVVTFHYQLDDGKWQDAHLAFDTSNSREEILASIREYVSNLHAQANATPADLSQDMGREYDLVDLPDRLQLIAAKQIQV